jgi:hypothetical protein
VEGERAEISLKKEIEPEKMGCTHRFLKGGGEKCRLPIGISVK